MSLLLLLSAAAVLAVPAHAQEEAVSEARLRSDVEALVGFGTRHTLSVQDDPKRGIGAARTWGEEQFRAASKACDDCLEIVLPERMVSGTRVPQPTRLVNVVAIQRGTERPNEVVIVQGHIDSRVTDVMDATSDAPGANDDGSGTALAIEAARVLSQHKYPTTIVYALLSGEEQGLYGGQLLADYAQEQGWTVKAVLNNDIVGGSCGSDGFCDAAHVRLFSEGPRADVNEKVLADMARFGGENDSRGAISLATLPVSPKGTTWPYGKYGVRTGWEGAAISCPSSTRATRRFASRWRSRTTTTSTRTCGSRMA